MFKKLAIIFFGLLVASCSGINNRPRITSVGGSYDTSKEVVTPKEDTAGFKVGMLLPLSGKSSVYGIGLKNAALMALEDTNDNNLVLRFYDTQSTPQGAVNAIENAINENVNLVLGPLMSDEVAAVSSRALNGNVPLISFSTSPNVLKEGVYTLGLLGDEQIRKVISYAANKQRKKIVLMLPDTTAGLNMAKSAYFNALKVGAEIVKIGFYPADTLDFAPMVKSLTDYDKRSEEITNRKKQLEKLANQGDKEAQKELKMIKNVYTTGEVDFDAVLIAETGSRLKSAAVMFGYYDIYYPDIMFLGTSIWENTNLNRETTLYHGVYPVISRVHNNYFNKKYEKLFGAQPNQLYSFAYDGVALASALGKKNNENIYESITDANGYIGINGAFRILKNGTNEHSLDVVEVTQNGPKVVSKAPENFSDTTYDEYMLHTASFPLVFGKDEAVVKEYILGNQKTQNGFAF
ncbi:MAG: penicillin-binding protein activator [Alphaproteobacteria bacterium]|nr:penicillin-binding protein activator [Alphaproteobacteria bacterium]